MQDNLSIPYGHCHCGCGGLAPLADKTEHARGYVKGQPRRFINGHHARLAPFRYVEEDRGYETPCWVWQWSVDTKGYGTVRFRDGATARAHRVVYEEHLGPIPDGLELDHLCRVRACVNPDHLEPVTQRENLLRGESPAAKNARKTHCIQGHALAGDNLHVRPNGTRRCRTCDRQRDLARPLRPNTSPTKHCARCGFECQREDAATYFHKLNSRDGFQSRCKACARERWSR